MNIPQRGKLTFFPVAGKPLQAPVCVPLMVTSRMTASSVAYRFLTSIRKSRPAAEGAFAYSRGEPDHGQCDGRPMARSSYRASWAKSAKNAVKIMQIFESKVFLNNLNSGFSWRASLDFCFHLAVLRYVWPYRPMANSLPRCSFEPSYRKLNF